jgi:hypothetical protein
MVLRSGDPSARLRSVAGRLTATSRHMVVAAATTPEWIAAIGGSLSLILAFRILLRDRARAVAEQASQIACWRFEQTLTYTPDDVDPDEVEEWSLEHDVIVALVDEVHVHNASSRPITDVRLRYRPMSKREVRRAFDTWDLEHFKVKPRPSHEYGLGGGLLMPEVPTYKGALMPGETALEDYADPEAGSQYQRRWACFRDANGVGWLRDLADGRLMRDGSLRTRLRLRSGSLWQSLFVRDVRNIFRWWENP